MCARVRVCVCAQRGRMMPSDVHLERWNQQEDRDPADWLYEEPRAETKTVKPVPPCRWGWGSRPTRPVRVLEYPGSPRPCQGSVAAPGTRGALGRTQVRGGAGTWPGLVANWGVALHVQAIHKYFSSLTSLSRFQYL